MNLQFLLCESFMLLATSHFSMSAGTLPPNSVQLSGVSNKYPLETLALFINILVPGGVVFLLIEIKGDNSIA